MKIPAQTKPAIWGAVGGALLCMVVGFTWGGWVTGATARQEAAAAAQDARVAALAPICAQGFRDQVDAADKLAELTATSSWARADLIQKSGVVVMPGSETVDTDVARACARILTQPATSKT
ncbi:MAG: hypothetical protein KIS73_05340 [Enhydrobacter sp.]|nr:hypothetical protein [Enhydrobacter sp.]